MWLHPCALLTLMFMPRACKMEHLAIALAHEHGVCTCSRGLHVWATTHDVARSLRDGTSLNSSCTTSWVCCEWEQHVIMPWGSEDGTSSDNLMHMITWCECGLLTWWVGHECLHSWCTHQVNNPLCSGFIDIKRCEQHESNLLLSMLIPPSCCQ